MVTFQASAWHRDVDPLGIAELDYHRRATRIGTGKNERRPASAANRRRPTRRAADDALPREGSRIECAGRGHAARPWPPASGSHQRDQRLRM